jgi:carboxymethylenebutenolidase
VNKKLPSFGSHLRSLKKEIFYMKTERLDIKTSEGECDSFIAYPSEQGSYPAIIFLMDGFGPRPWLYEMAEGLASHGYYVLLPNLFYRLCRAPVMEMKPPLRPEDMPELIKQVYSWLQNYSSDLAMRDIGVFLDFLAAQKNVLSGPMGIVGYCMSGGLSLRAAGQFPDRIAAAASFHSGNLATDAPDSPHLFLPNVKGQLYIAHADEDKSMPSEQMERLLSALDQAHVHYEAELYLGAHHGFVMTDLPAYNEVAHKRHWDKLLSLFKRSLPNVPKIL